MSSARPAGPTGRTRPSSTDAPEADLEICTHLAVIYTRESIFRSSRAELDVEQVLAGVLLAWHEIRDELPSHDALEHARALAAELAGSATQTTPVEHSTAYL